jgi:hypothetical protein
MYANKLFEIGIIYYFYMICFFFGSLAQLHLIYIGAHLICIDNKHLKSKTPRSNGTLCRVLGVKLKENATTYNWKNHYGKKVWIVNAKDVEWIRCEHVNKPGYIVQLESQIKDLEKYKT